MEIKKVRNYVEKYLKKHLTFLKLHNNRKEDPYFIHFYSNLKIKQKFLVILIGIIIMGMILCYSAVQLAFHFYDRQIYEEYRMIRYLKILFICEVVFSLFLLAF